jgi:hypothetical protein
VFFISGFFCLSFLLRSLYTIMMILMMRLMKKEVEEDIIFLLKLVQQIEKLIVKLCSTANLGPADDDRL